MRKRQAIFLDRDGVVNEVVYRDGQPASPRDLSEFRIIEGVQKALSNLHRAGYYLFVISNQPDIARGLLKQYTLNEMNQLILNTLPVDGVLNCVHDTRDGCNCRKPKPGMIYQVTRTANIDLSNSYVIGDSWKDMKAGRFAGCKCILLRRIYNQNVAADYTADNLQDAVNLILKY